MQNNRNTLYFWDDNENQVLKSEIIDKFAVYNCYNLLDKVNKQCDTLL